MRFVSVRELRNQTADVWSSLDREDIVLTSNGRPLAVLVAVPEGELDTTLALVRRARAQAALTRLRREAARSGAATITQEEIDEEVAGARRVRSR